MPLVSFSFMDMSTEYVVTEFVTVAAGTPFRLLPFGTLVKNGRRREVTPELAARFQLPHFRPPIKLGSHADATPAGGHIVALEVRDDGLYAVPEFNSEGAAAMARGAYRYHSPEIVWDGGLENPLTGVMQTGPLIVGDALLHTPHLGEAAALYAADISQGENRMTSENVTMPASLLDRLLSALLGRQPDPAAPEPDTPPPAPASEPVALSAVVAVDRFAALQAERDDLATQIAQMQAAAAAAARVDHFASELVGTSLAGDAELPALLAALPDAPATELTRRLKALAEQNRVAALTANVGHEGAAVTGDPTAQLDAAIRAKMTAEKVDYNTALVKVTAENPALITAAYGGN